MSKFAGLVGYVTEEESAPGVWSATEQTRVMRGDVLRTASVFQGEGRVNKDITLQHRISLVGDALSFESFYEMRWIAYLGTKWEITSIEVARPRLIVTLGGRWNG